MQTLGPPTDAAASPCPQEELVALSGAHTLGGKGFGNPFEFTNVYYKELLRRPWLGEDPAVVKLWGGKDMAKMIGLPSDHVLPDDAECLEVIERYAADEAAFFAGFSRAYLRLASLGVGGGGAAA